MNLPVTIAYYRLLKPVHFITEKLATGLKANMVPLVIGSRDVSRVAPPGSYIHVLDYSSPNELADYLKLLHQNDTLYKSYFKWKESYQHYRNLDEKKRLFCRLCKFLHSKNAKKRLVISHFYNWFFNESNCVNDKISKLLSSKSDQTS